MSLLARDGSTMADLPAQFTGLPQRADVAVLSVGGNDAIDYVGIPEQPASSSAEVLAQLYDMAEDFASKYQRTLADLRPRVERLVLCTIYEPALRDPTTARLARVPLAILNDRIVRAGGGLGLDVIDLRAVCADPADFVQEIEPSASGARKIAGAIEAVVRNPSPHPPVRIFAA